MKLTSISMSLLFIENNPYMGLTPYDYLILFSSGITSILFGFS